MINHPEFEDQYGEPVYVGQPVNVPAMSNHPQMMADSMIINPQDMPTSQERDFGGGPMPMAMAPDHQQPQHQQYPNI